GGADDEDVFHRANTSAEIFIPGAPISASLSMTDSTEISAMFFPDTPCINGSCVSGSVLPNKPSAGTSTATATLMMPVSFPTQKSQFFSAAADINTDG